MKTVVSDIYLLHALLLTLWKGETSLRSPGPRSSAQACGHEWMPTLSPCACDLTEISEAGHTLVHTIQRHTNLGVIYVETS